MNQRLSPGTTRDQSSKNQEIVGDDGERKRKSATHTESPSPTKLPRRPGDAIQGAEDVTRLSSDLRGASTRSRSSSPSKIPRAVPPSMVSPKQALTGTPAEPVSPKKKNPEAKRYGRSTIMADKVRMIPILAPGILLRNHSAVKETTGPALSPRAAILSRRPTYIPSP